VKWQKKKKGPMEFKVESGTHSGQLVVRPTRGPRHGWAAAFKKMARYGDDKLLDEGDPATQWTRQEWK